MKKSNIRCRSRIIISSKDGFRLEFSEAVKVELSCKGREVGVLKVLGQDR